MLHEVEEKGAEKWRTGDIPRAARKQNRKEFQDNEREQF